MLKSLIPFYFLIISGYLLKGISIYNDDGDRFLNWLCFNFLLPIVLIKGIVFSKSLPTRDILLSVLFILIVFVIGFFMLNFRITDRRSLILALRGNHVYFGIPLMNMFMDGASFDNALLFISIISPFVIIMVGFLSPDGESSMEKLFKNPFLYIIILGLILRNFPGYLTPFRDFFDDISGTLFIISLIIIGANINIKGNKPVSDSLLPLLIKHFILPLCFIAYSHFVPLMPLSFKIMLILMCTPTAITNYTIIKGFGYAHKGDANLIVISNLLFTLYLPILLWIIK